MNPHRRPPRSLRSRQKGIIAVMAVVFVLFVIVFSLGQTLAISSTNVVDTSRQADSIEALFLAESAMEKIGGKVGNDPAWTCDDTYMGVGEAATAMGRGTFEVLATATTDFSGATLPTSLCRVKVRGTITATNVTRTLETIVGKVDDLISIAALNPDFNIVPYTGDRSNDLTVDFKPDNWVFDYPDSLGTNLPWHAWDKDGGPDGSRSAFARKTRTGNDQQTAGGAFSITAGDVEFTGPIVLRLSFDYRVWAGGGSGSNPMYLSPSLESYAGDVYTPTSTATGCASFVFCAGSTYTTTDPEPDCGYKDTASLPESFGDASCPDPPTGSAGYETGFVTFTIPTTGLIQLKKLSFQMQVKSGQPAWAWLDNFRLSVPSLEGGSPNKMWREVSF